WSHRTKLEIFVWMMTLCTLVLALLLLASAKIFLWNPINHPIKEPLLPETPPSIGQVFPDLPTRFAPKSDLSPQGSLSLGGQIIESNGLYGYVDFDFSPVLPLQYQKIEFAYGLLLARHESIYELYQQTSQKSSAPTQYGRFVLVSTTTSTQSISLYDNQRLQNEQGLLTLHFEPILFDDYLATSVSKEHFWIIYSPQNKKFGVYKDSKILVDPLFDSIQDFCYGTTIAILDGTRYIVYADGYYAPLLVPTAQRIAGYGHGLLILFGTNGLTLFDNALNTSLETRLVSLESGFIGSFLVGKSKQGTFLMYQLVSPSKQSHSLQTKIPLQLNLVLDNMYAILPFDGGMILNYDGVQIDLVQTDAMLTPLLQSVTNASVYDSDILLVRDQYELLCEILDT
ncbi:MAG: hypothetical protein FWD76_02165, partial [Firmicutes bacterium]|nr:hypothetical protein [Bacillota bacterium]